MQTLKIKEWMFLKMRQSGCLQNEIDNFSDNAKVNENLDYAASLDDTGNDPENLVANLDAGENPNSLEGYQNSEK